MNVLLTGGSGNLGSRLVIPLVRRGDKVTTFDVRPNPHFQSKEFGQADVIIGDLADRDALIAAVRSRKIESIFHLGAVLSASAEQDPYSAWRANMDGVANILEAARAGSVRSLIFSSTIATYGEQVAERLTDDAPQWPTSLYGVTKVAGERLGAYYGHRFGLDFRGIRLPAVLAARGAGGGASAYCSAVFEKVVSDGAYEFYVRPATRAPMVYISDAVRALLELHDVPRKNLTRSIYNIFGFAPSAQELAQAIKKRLPWVALSFNPDPLRTAIVESWPYQVDDSSAKRDWNWSPAWDLDNTAREIIDELQREYAHQ